MPHVLIYTIVPYVLLYPGPPTDLFYAVTQSVSYAALTQVYTLSLVLDAFLTYSIATEGCGSVARTTLLMDHRNNMTALSEGH